MNQHHRSTGTFDDFENALHDGLDRLAAQALAVAPGAFDPDAMSARSASDGAARRWTPYLVGAAAAALIAGLVVLPRPGHIQPATATLPAQSLPMGSNAATASSASSTVPTAVRGTPVCGAELPAPVLVSAAIGEAQPGPAVYGPTLDGQFAQHWELPNGTVEVRWPADERELYDVDTPRKRGDIRAFESMSASAPNDGSSVTIDVSNLDSTITLSRPPDTAALHAPCDVLQVRLIDLDGSQFTLGYRLTGPTEPLFGIDLNPLIVDTNPSELPDPDTIVSCGPGRDIDTAVDGPAAATAAEALLTFLESPQAPAGLYHSGYHEFTARESEVIYTITNDLGLITHITTTRSNDGWAASHLSSVGC